MISGFDGERFIAWENGIRALIGLTRREADQIISFDAGEWDIGDRPAKPGSEAWVIGALQHAGFFTIRHPETVAEHLPGQHSQAKHGRPATPGNPADALVDGTTATGWPGKVFPKGYLYHGTPAKNLEAIREHGLKGQGYRVGDKDPFEDVVFFAKHNDPGGALDHSYDPDSDAPGSRLLLRMKDDTSLPFGNMLGDPVVKGSVPPEHLEMWGDDGSWHPLGSIAEHLKGKHDQSRHGRGGGGAPLDFDTPEQADAALGAAYKGWHDSLTTGAGQAFGDYSALGYRPINGRLRQGHALTAAQKRQVAELDNALASASAPEMIVYRGMKQKVLPAPAWQMVGRTMTDEGFMSTSASRDIGAKFAGYAKDAGAAPVVIRVRVPKGYNAGAVTGAARNKGGGLMGMGESEVLMRRGTTLRFTGFEPQTYSVFGGETTFGTLIAEIVE